MMVAQEFNPSYAPSLRRDNGRADIAHRPALREFSATPPADHGNQRPARSARPVPDQPTGLAPPPCGGHGTSAGGAKPPPARPGSLSVSAVGCGTPRRGEPQRVTRPT